METNKEKFSEKFLEILSTNNIRGYATTLDFANLGVVKDSGAKFSQYDLNVDSIAIQLLNSGEPISLTEDSICYASIKNQIGGIVNNPVKILDYKTGSIVVDLKEQCLQTVGICSMEIIILFTDKIGKGKRKLVSPYLNFQVFASYDTGGTLDSLTVLDESLLTLQKGMDSLGATKDLMDAEIKKINDSTSSLNQLVANGKDAIGELKSLSASMDLSSKEISGFVSSAESIRADLDTKISYLENEISILNKDYKTRESVNISSPSNSILVKNTINAPITNFMIKGKTIKNICPSFRYDFSTPTDKSNYKVLSDDIGTIYVSIINKIPEFAFVNCGSVGTFLEPSTTYNVYFEGQGVESIGFIDASYKIVDSTQCTKISNNHFQVTTKPVVSGSKDVLIYVSIVNESNTQVIISNMVICKDEYNYGTSPFVSGLNSVGDSGSIKLGTTGTNIFNLVQPNGGTENCQAKIIDDVTFSVFNTQAESWGNVEWQINVKENTDYVLSSSVSSLNPNCEWMSIRDLSGNLILDIPSCNGEFNTGENSTIKFCVFCTAETVEINTVTVKNLMIVEKALGTTEFEIYKEPSNLVASLPIENGLKSLETVFDEIFNGVLTQRVGCVVIDGTKSWQFHQYHTDENCLIFTDAIDNWCKNGADELLTSGFPTLHNATIESYVFGINGSAPNNCEGFWKGATSGTGLFLWCHKSRFATLDTNGINAYFKENPCTVYFELNEPTSYNLAPVTGFNAMDTTTIINNNNNIVTDIEVDIPINIGNVIANQQEQINNLLNGKG